MKKINYIKNKQMNKIKNNLIQRVKLENWKMSYKIIKIILNFNNQVVKIKLKS